MVSLILLEVFLEYGIYVMRFFEILTVMTLSSDIPTDMLRFLLGTHCRECFVQLALRAQTGTCIRGSVFLTTEASQLSVGISEDSGTA